MDFVGQRAIEGREPTTNPPFTKEAEIQAARERAKPTQQKLAGWQTANGTIEATWSKALGLTIHVDGRLVGCHMHTARAMALVNELAGETVWSV